MPDGVRLHVDSNDPTERWLLYAGNYQPALTHLLQTHTPVEGYCMDIGANLGFYALKFARWVGAQGRVAAFEANPWLANRIQENTRLNGFTQVDVVANAVHHEAGEITFYVSDSLGKSSVMAAHVPRPAQTLLVPAITLDTYLQQQGWERLDVLKLDIEGNDCHALLGAREALARFRPFIVFEFWYNTPSEITEAVFDLLKSLNYSLSYLLLDGRQIPFDRQQRTDGHVDVVCLPPSNI
jgi:FkbM family methyltransferase